MYLEKSKQLIIIYNLEQRGYYYLEAVPVTGIQDPA
jgi:hypothetical protein